MFNLLVEFGNKDSIRKQDNSLFELEKRMISEFNVRAGWLSTGYVPLSSSVI